MNSETNPKNTPKEKTAARGRRPFLVSLISLGVAWAAIRFGNGFAPARGLRSIAGQPLGACPDSPNCVSTSEKRLESLVQPLPIQGTAEETFEALKQILSRMRGVKIVTSEDGYIHAEFTSAVLGFVDDLELLVDDQNNQVHIRSASRVGYSDMGVNRKRVDELRRLYNAS